MDTNGTSRRHRRKAAHSYHTHNDLRLLRHGKDFFGLLETMIDEARECIHLQTYIFQHDSTGIAVAERLAAAAARGVKVYVLVDGYASQGLPRDFIEQLRAGGIYFSFFEPLLKSRRFYFGRRLHHKVFVADGRRALVGASNIADRYNDLPGIPAWLNMDLYLEGETAADLENVCRNLWNKRGHRTQIPARPAAPKNDFPEGYPIRVRRNDWVKTQNQVSRSYKELFQTAQHEIYILCSYFLPGITFRRLMKQAVERGVTIRVVVAGRSDVMFAKHAERYLYRWMLRNRIELYEYQPTVLHAKIASRDGEWMTVGSYNVNDLSAYASIELNIDIFSPEFTARAEAGMRDIIEHECRQILPGRHAPAYQRLWEWIAYQSLRVLLFLFTFYFRKEKE